MGEQEHTLLDNYFNGLLSEQEQQAVLQRAGSDAAFAAAFEQRLLMAQWLVAEPARADVRQLTTQLGDEYFGAADQTVAPPAPLVVSHRNTGGWWRYGAAAAAVAALLVAAWWFLQPTRPQDLYAAYAQHAPLELTVRGNAPDTDAMTRAEQAFGKKDYTAALQTLQTLRQTDNQAVYQLYEAICLTELGQTAEARTLLQPLADGSTVLAGEAQWYTALSYLKDKNDAAAAEALRGIGPDNGRYAAAQQLLGWVRQ